MDMRQLTIIVCSIAVFLMTITVALPWMVGDSHASRLKSIQEKRNAYRATLKKEVKRSSMREQLMKESFTQDLVKKLKFSQYVNMPKLKLKLQNAGWRDRNTLSKYLIARIALPIGLFFYGSFLVFGGPLKNTIDGDTKKYAFVIGAAVVGFFLPALLLNNSIQKRNQKLSRQFPDALDLMMVVVEAGLSTDQAFQRVTEEIGESIPEVAEEFAITGAELAYLNDNRQAMENMYKRTNNQDFQSLATVLTQAMEHGTKVADALRIISEESRQRRVNLIEKKAASLGPKMTVPMILFILPCMFLILIGPSVIKIMAIP
jgi:tight adherence protein C